MNILKTTVLVYVGWISWNVNHISKKQCYFKSLWRSRHRNACLNSSTSLRAQRGLCWCLRLRLTCLRTCGRQQPRSWSPDKATLVWRSQHIWTQLCLSADPRTPDGQRGDTVCSEPEPQVLEEFLDSASGHVSFGLWPQQLEPNTFCAENKSARSDFDMMIRAEQHCPLRPVVSAFSQNNSEYPR